MAKLWEKIKKRKHSRKSNNRFYTSRDMAIVKHDVAVRNSRIKRGDITTTNNHQIYECGCGAEGCFIHSSYKTMTQEQKNNFEKRLKNNHH